MPFLSQNSLSCDSDQVSIMELDSPAQADCTVSEAVSVASRCFSQARRELRRTAATSWSRWVSSACCVFVMGEM